jgi:hypothetical protein
MLSRGGSSSSQLHSLDRFRDTVTNPKFTDVVISRKALEKVVGFNENEIRLVQIWQANISHPYDASS